LKGAFAVTVGAHPGNRSVFVVFLLIVVLVVAACQAQDADDSELADDEMTTEETDSEPVEETDSDEAPTPESPSTDFADEEVGDDSEIDDETEVSVEPTPDADDDRRAEAGFPVTVTRSDNVELTIEEQPQRIVSLSPGATEIFFEIGAADQLAAVDMFADYPPETDDYPRVDAFQPDPEAIIDHDPDLVFIVYDADGIVDVLDDLDVPVLYLEAPGSLGELLDHVRLMGEVTGNEEQASAVAGSLAERVELVAGQVSEVENRPVIYHELDDSYFTVGPDSFVGDLYNVLGAENIADGAMGEYPQLSEEIILEEDPDVIILPGYGDDGAVDAVRERSGWEVISAVENDRIYEIDGDIVSRPGPRIVDALEQLAEMLYPEEFSSSYDLAIGEIHIESPTAAF
jgi:iron complex transport system substrate-binding protein